LSSFNVYASIFSIKLLSIPYDITWSFDSVLTISNLSLLFGIAVYSVTFLFSSLISNRGTVNSIALGFVFGGYGFNLAASLEDSVEFLKYISIFNYYDHIGALAGDSIKTGNILFFVCVIVISFIGGLFIFNKRDISV
jgi:hypothetical protein